MIADPVHPPPLREITVRFPGRCSQCGGHLAEGDLALHRPGELRHRQCRDGAPPLTGDLVLRLPEPVAPPRSQPPDGAYTVVSPDGPRPHLTLRLRTSPDDADFAPGKRIVAYLSGPNNGHDWTSCGFLTPQGTFRCWQRFRGGQFEREVTEAVRTLLALADPAVAGEAYALRSGRCCRCQRLLTVPASILRGLGPECARLREDSS